MAPGRLYRDYSILEKESFDLTMEDQGDHTTRDCGVPDSPQTAILGNSPPPATNTKYIGAGIAQTTDNARADSATSNRPSMEPVLHQEQMDDSQYFEDAAPAPAIPWHMRALSPSASSNFSPSRAPESVFSQDQASPSTYPSSNSGSSKKMPEFFSSLTFQTADNPIVFASDGFVKVTGYQRTDIIPRNCRFLQSHETEKQVVKRLRTAIDKREESVELLLNRKKNGEPFWNLLYTTPLFDEHGNLLFFLGGQINCSTTIHSSSDVLRILAQSNEPAEGEEPAGNAPAPRSVKPSRSRTILRNLPFRTGNRNSVQPRAPGMEDTLLTQNGNKTLKDQMNSFYTAYSNYIVINYTSFLIAFVSSGILDLLFPIKARTAQQAQAVGSDIFKFLGNHGTGSVSSDFKSAVKSNLKSGQPISLDLKLCARPYMGIEKFVLHWTPLKDERGEVQWVVLTFGNEQRVGLAT